MDCAGFYSDAKKELKSMGIEPCKTRDFSDAVDSLALSVPAGAWTFQSVQKESSAGRKTIDSIQIANQLSFTDEQSCVAAPTRQHLPQPIGPSRLVQGRWQD